VAAECAAQVDDGLSGPDPGVLDREGDLAAGDFPIVVAVALRVAR
jgi:hypothetical protein